MYQILFSDLAYRQLQKLDKEIQKRIGSALERIRTRPEQFVKRLTGYALYSLRVGDHRIVIDVDRGKLIILVMEIGHRKKIYKRL